MDSIKIRRALVSVSDKTGIVEFARTLHELGVEILSTGGTASLLSKNHIPVRSVDSYTGFPEIMDGRVKTLHPKVHGGLLAIRTNANHTRQMEDNAIEPIDMVVVNLYPFTQTIAKPDVSIEEAIENIDIGGPTMIRSAAKNHAFVTVLVDTVDYQTVTSEIQSGGVTAQTRKLLATKAFQHTSRYDSSIHTYLSKVYGAASREEM